MSLLLLPVVIMPLLHESRRMLDDLSGFLHGMTGREFAKRYAFHALSDFNDVPVWVKYADDTLPLRILLQIVQALHLRMLREQLYKSINALLLLETRYVRASSE